MTSAILGEITFADGLHGWEKRAITTLNYTSEFALQLRKSRENLNQCSRVVTDCLLLQSGCFIGTAWAGLLNICSPRERRPWALGWNKGFPSFRSKLFPALSTLSGNTQTAHCCRRRRVKSPNSIKFSSYQRTKARQLQGEYTWIVKLRGRRYGCGQRSPRSDMRRWW
jgi:hypothetical protein